MLFTTTCYAAFVQQDLLFIRLGVVSYKLIRLTQYSHKQLCLLEFSSGFAGLITNVWMTMTMCNDDRQLILAICLSLNLVNALNQQKIVCTQLYTIIILFIHIYSYVCSYVLWTYVYYIATKPMIPMMIIHIMGQTN